MATIPAPKNTTASAIYAWYEAHDDGGLRPHLGASLIGHPCARYLWNTFRWVDKENFSGRLLRLFDTGKREEFRFCEELRGIGCEVHEVDEHGNQFRVSAIGDHFGGSMDAVAKGIPEAPKSWHVVEMKTHNAKSFADLVKQGVQASKPQHYAQMQVYLGLNGLSRALYLATNKDTSEIYAERIELDPGEFERLMARAESIITATEPPPRIHSDPAWYQCKFCPFHGNCHGKRAPLVNCRTCAHSTPLLDRDGGQWACECGTGRPLVTLPIKHQHEGCDMHRFIPILLENIGTVIDASAWAVKYDTITNGDGGLTSQQIRDASC